MLWEMFENTWEVLLYGFLISVNSRSSAIGLYKDILALNGFGRRVENTLCLLQKYIEVSCCVMQINKQKCIHHKSSVIFRGLVLNITLTVQKH